MPLRAAPDVERGQRTPPGTPLCTTSATALHERQQQPLPGRAVQAQPHMAIPTEQRSMRR